MTKDITPQNQPFDLYMGIVQNLTQQQQQFKLQEQEENTKDVIKVKPIKSSEKIEQDIQLKKIENNSQEISRPARNPNDVMPEEAKAKFAVLKTF